MKKAFLTAVLLTVLFFLCPRACAEEMSEELGEIYDHVNERLENALDEETANDLREADISMDPESIISIDERGVFQRLWDRFTDGFRQEISLLGKFLAISAIAACLRGICPENSGTERVFSIVVLLSVISAASGALSRSFEQLRTSIDTINSFMISYIPVFSAVTASGGYAAAASGYGAGTLLICEAASAVSSGLLMPFLNGVTAMTLVSSLDPRLKMSGFSESVKKAVTRTLTVLMILFVGLMGLKGVVAASADDLASRSMRFAASSFIPVVGGYVSDAYLAVKNGMRVIRSAAGAVGMIAVCLIAVRPMILLVSMKLMVWLGGLANDLLGNSDSAGLLRSINDILSIAVGILIAFTSAFIISTAAMIAIVSGGG